MWTTLSSRARARGWAWISVLVMCMALLGAGLTACGTGEVQARQEGEPVAPDAPRPRPTEDDKSELPLSESREWLQPVALSGVEVRPLDDALSELAGEAFLEKASDPLAIVVLTEAPLDPTPRTSWPVIVLNDMVLDNSRMVLEGEALALVAFLPDAELIKVRNTVEVYWVGNEELTRTKEPLVFTAEEMGLGQ